MSFIRVETVTEIAKVTLDHPTGNRINFAMREELLQAFQRVADSKARVLVVRGKGPTSRWAVMSATGPVNRPPN
jgi:enoyl-CoA hydratase/carnithine racemase